MVAARLGLDHWIPETIIHVVYQQPRSPVGYAQIATGLRDRSGLVDGFQQPNLSRTQSAAGAQVYSQGQLRRFHDCRPNRGGSLFGECSPI